MLVLTRKASQSIMIGDEIEVSVLSIMGEKVRIGIQAPRDIPVFRKEVYLEIQQERGEDPQGRGFLRSQDEPPPRSNLCEIIIDQVSWQASCPMFGQDAKIR